jgi:uncharacterized protein YdeI (YjbR/CyaY-like superfamily)
MIHANAFATAHYNQLTKVRKDYFVRWVMSAKKEETRLKRAKEMIRLLEKNEKLGMK